MLEDEETRVRKLYDRTAREDRHTGAMILLAEPIGERALPDPRQWNAMLQRFCLLERLPEGKKYLWTLLVSSNR